MMQKQQTKQFDIYIENDISLNKQRKTEDQFQSEENDHLEENSQIKNEQQRHSKLFQIEKTIQLNGKIIFSYIGPANKEVLSIIDMIEEGIESNQFFSSLYQCALRVKLSADGFFNKCCTCFQGTLNISFAEFVFGIFIIAFTFMFSFVIYDVNIPVKYGESWQLYVQDKIFLYAFLFSILGLFYLKIDKRLKLVFCVGIIAYVLFDIMLSQNVIEFQNSNETANGQSIFFWIFSGVFLLNWNVVYFLWKFIEKKYTDIISLGCCLFLEIYVVYGCGLFFLKQALYDDGIELWKRLIDILLPMIVFLISLAYCYIHYNLFYSKTDTFKIILDEIAQTIKNKQEQAFQSEEEAQQSNVQSNSCYQRMKRFINNRCLLITQTLIFLSYFIYEGFFLYKMRSSIAREIIDTDSLFLSIFHIIFLPLFLILGILISSTNMYMKNKTLIYPLLQGVLALTVMIPLYNYLSNKGNMDYISYYPIVGLPSIFIFWMTLSLFGYRYRKKYLYCLTFILAFFIIPLILLAITKSNTTFFESNEQAFAIAIILLSIGCLIIAIMGIVNLVHMIMKSLKFGDSSVHTFLISIRYYNFENVTYYINGCCFIVGYTLLTYGLYKKPSDVSGDKKGILYSLLTIYPLILVLFNAIIRIKPFNIQEKQYNESQNIIINLQILIPFFIGAFGLLKHIKDNNPQFQKFLAPFLISTAWGFCILPFLAIVPVIALFINSESEEYGRFLKYVIGCGAFLIMLGVTGFTIFFHIILNKIELDKLRRFIVYQLQIMLFHNAVMSEVKILHYLLDFYLRAKHFSIFKEQMIRGEPVFWVPFTSENDLNYSNELVTTNEYQRISKNNDRKEQIKRKRTCLQYLCCLESNVQEFKTEQQIIQDESNKEIKPESLDDKVQQLLGKEMENEDYEEIKNIDQFLFPYMLKVKHFQDEIEPKLLEKIEKRNRQYDLSQIDKSKKNEFKSSKSIQLSQISNQNSLDVSTLSYNEHYLHVKESENAKLELLHHIFFQFSNNDNQESDEELVIFCDVIQFIRISNLEFTDSFLSWAFDQCALVNWNYKTFGMNIQGFAIFLKKITDKFYMGSESKTIVYYFKIIQNFKSNFNMQYDLCVDQLYHNIMGNCPDVAINFRMQYRTLDQIQKKWEIMLKDSPFKISTNPELQKNPNTSLISNTFELSLIQRKNKLLFGSYDDQGDQSNSKEEQKEDQKNESNIKCCSCSQCSIKQCMRLIWISIKGCLCFIPILIKNSIQNQKVDNNNQDQIEKLKNKNLVKRRSSPSWETIVDLTILTIKDSEKSFSKLKQTHIQKINLNFGNVLVIFDRICDSYVFLSLAIHQSIKWSIISDFTLSLSEYSIFDGQTGAVNIYLFIEFIYQKIILNQFLCLQKLGYDYFFWFSVVCSFLYGLLSLISLKHLKNDTLGLTESGQMATFPHPQFFLTKIIQIIGQNLFQLIMRSFIDSFVCSWSGVRPWIMIRDDQVICFSDIHYLHICFAFLGLLIYYPFTTFIFPNFQFTQKLTDIKYQPSFLVLFQQGQLLILGATSFLRSEENNDFQMIVTLSLVITIQVLNIALIFKVWPCTVYWWNIVDIGLSLAVAIVCSGGLFIYITGQSLIGTIVTIVMICLTILGTFIFSRKIYKQHAQDQALKIVQDMPKIMLSKDKSILKSRIAPLPLTKNK